MSNAERIIRLDTVRARTGLSRSTIYRMVAKGQFPAPVQLSANRVAWMEGAVQGWKNQQAGGPPI